MRRAWHKTKTFAPFDGGWYYLVVPTNGVEEGSYGTVIESTLRDRRQGELPGRGSATLALMLLVPVPTIGLLVVLLGPKDETGEATLLGQGVWALSKLWILLFPVLWHRFVDGMQARIPKPSGRGMPAAVITGIAIAITILVAHATLGRDWIAGSGAGERIADTGLDKPWLFLLMAVYWCTVNSLLEEYVWRWFVFTRCEAIMQRYLAVIAAGLFFTIHHAVALSLYFDDARVVVLATLGVWIGGATWSWIYLRWRNIYAAYVSHVFADVVIFWIGYQLVFVQG
jgi:membrane protease YdiL (CAAX protease family)